MKLVRDQSYLSHLIIANFPFRFVCVGVQLDADIQSRAGRSCANQVHHHFGKRKRGQSEWRLIKVFGICSGEGFRAFGGVVESNTDTVWGGV